MRLTASPRRWASPAKSPPTSSAKRSASAKRLRTLVSASSQPSLAVRRNCCSIASWNFSPAEPVETSASTQPYSAATLSDPARVSTSWTSMSGFLPGVIRRKILSSASSPKATDELLCSPVNGVDCADGSSGSPGSRWKVSGPSGG